MQHLREAVRLEPDADSRLQLARLLHHTGQPREAVAQYRQVVSLKPDSVEALNNLAWLLATSADDSLRNGAEAVRAAERACRITGYKEVVPLGTLAAAYAEAGRFQRCGAGCREVPSVSHRQQRRSLRNHQPATAAPLPRRQTVS